MICPQCKTEFEPYRSTQKYCSALCGNRYASLSNSRRKRALKKEAQEGFNERTWRIMNMTIAEYCDQRDHKQKRYVKKDSLRYFAGAWNPDLKGQPCENCGYDKHTELAHIKAVSDFPDTALLKEVHARENLKVLCPNCHWEYDNGLLP